MQLVPTKKLFFDCTSARTFGHGAFSSYQQAVVAVVVVAIVALIALVALVAVVSLCDDP